MMSVKYKIVIAGQTSVGKTSLVLRFTQDKFTETKSTIGVGFAIKDVHTERSGKIRLQIWDFAGEERFRTLLGPFCTGAAGAILLHDLTDPDTFTKLDDWIRIVRSNTGDLVAGGEKHPVPVLLAGAKKDLVHGPRSVPREQIDAFMKKHGITAYFEISSKTGENVEDVFSILVKAMLDLYE